MKKTIVLSLSLISLVSLLSGFALSRSSQTVGIKMHIKDLPQHNLRLIGPSDPSFDERLRTELKGESNELVDTLKPFSVFFENKGERPVVAYLIQWCFTTKEGRNQYFRKALMNPQPFMEGENLSQELKWQSGRIEPDSARFLSLLSTDGSGMLRAEVSPKEAEELKQGKKFAQTSLLKRFSTQAEEFAEISVSIDGAFFDDGTFVGPDTSNFFAQIKAVIDARRDLLNEIAIGLSNPAMTTDSLYGRIQETAAHPIESIDSSSTPSDYYNYFKKFYASDILQTKKLHGQDKALAMAVQSMNKPWARLRKKQD
jgi:hypothetical protein